MINSKSGANSIAEIILPALISKATKIPEELAPKCKKEPIMLIRITTLIKTIN